MPPRTAPPARTRPGGRCMPGGTALAFVLGRLECRVRGRVEPDRDLAVQLRLANQGLDLGDGLEIADTPRPRQVPPQIADLAIVLVDRAQPRLAEIDLVGPTRHEAQIGRAH